MIWSRRRRRRREALLDEAFLRRLARLRLAALRAAGGRREGLRLGARSGGHIEFREHRDYTRGDELRAVDWNVYGRLDRLVVKTFVREEEAVATVLLDASASMAGEKFELGLRLAAALAYLALGAGDRARVGLIGGRVPGGERVARAGPLARLPFLAGTGEFPRALAFLAEAEAEGPTHLAGALALLAAERSTREAPGTVLVISDLWEEGPFLEPLAVLAARRAAPAVLHVLSPEELSPAFAGPVRLLDAEGAPAQELELSAESLASYRESLGARVARLRAFAAGHGARYHLVGSDRPLEETVLAYLRRGGLVA